MMRSKAISVLILVLALVVLVEAAQTAETITIRFSSTYQDGYSISGPQSDSVLGLIIGEAEVERDGVALSHLPGLENSGHEGSILIAAPPMSHLLIDVIDRSAMFNPGLRVSISAKGKAKTTSLFEKNFHGSGTLDIPILYQPDTQTVIEISASGYDYFIISKVTLYIGQQIVFSIPADDIEYLRTLPIDSKENALDYLRVYGRVAPEVYKYYQTAPSTTKPYTVLLFDQHRELLTEKAKLAREYLIDEETKHLDEPSRTLMRWAVKTGTVRLDERFTIYITSIGLTVATGGGATPLALAIAAGTTVTPDIAKEVVHTFQRDYQLIHVEQEKAIGLLIDAVSLASKVRAADNLYTLYKAGKLPWDEFVKRMIPIASELGLDFSTTTEGYKKDALVLKSKQTQIIIERGDNN